MNKLDYYARDLGEAMLETTTNKVRNADQSWTAEIIFKRDGTTLHTISKSAATEQEAESEAHAELGLVGPTLMPQIWES